VAALGAFGTNLGLAFQMTDDILDLVGDEAEFGKAVGRDLEEGMATLPMIYAEAGLWYDALGAIADLLDQSPNDQTVREGRAQLLSQAGLPKVE